jgi:hypothetical protein
MKPTFGRSSGTDKPREGTIRVLVDGLPLVWERNGPSNIHIWELLKAGEEAGIEMRLASPAYPNPLFYDAVVRNVSLSARGRLVWEQIVLPQLVRQTGAHLLHSLTGSLPLTCPVPCVFSPSGARATRGSGLFDYIQASLGRGGYTRARALLWPNDLPDPDAPIPVVHLPPHAHPVFSTTEFRLHHDLPDEYIFCPGPLDDAAQEKLAAAWSWVSSGLGEDWALVIDGISRQTADRIREQSKSTARVMGIQDVAVGTRAGLMQKSAVVLLVGKPVSWGDPLLQALACGRPVAAEENQWNALRAGPAAYLTPPGDARLLGAAALTLAVEESVAEGLAEAALVRAQTMRSESFSDRLLQVYREVLG